MRTVAGRPDAADTNALVEEICAGLRAGDGVIAMTGAGASAEAGIRPFRAPGNRGWLWSGIGACGVFLAGTGFAWSWWPWIARFFYYYFFKRSVDNARPTSCHAFFANEGAPAITTNVDGLHEAAGSAPDRVAAIHGTVHREMCNRCGSASLPCCGVPRPAVLFFADAIRNDVVGEAHNCANRIAVHPKRKTWVFVVGVSWAIPSFFPFLIRIRSPGVRVVHVNIDAPPTGYFAEGDTWVREPSAYFFTLLEIQRARDRAREKWAL